MCHSGFRSHSAAGVSMCRWSLVCSSHVVGPGARRSGCAARGPRRTRRMRLRRAQCHRDGHTARRTAGIRMPQRRPPPPGPGPTAAAEHGPRDGRQVLARRARDPLATLGQRGRDAAHPGRPARPAPLDHRRGPGPHPGGRRGRPTDGVPHPRARGTPPQGHHQDPGLGATRRTRSDRAGLGAPRRRGRTQSPAGPDQPAPCSCSIKTANPPTTRNANAAAARGWDPNATTP